MNCCNPGEYEKKFDEKLAEQELEDYLKNGIKNNSRVFLDTLRHLSIEGKILLDIGGGIGGITFELFKEGLSKATHIDISSAYVKAFRSESEVRGLSDQILSLHGDYLEHSSNIPTADLVVLDKVICCYQEFETLVKSSVSKAGTWYAFSIPRDIWWVRLEDSIERIKKWWTGNYFKMYFHPVSEIEQIILEAGFSKMIQTTQREWLIMVFEKQ